MDTGFRKCARDDSNIRPLVSETNALSKLSYGRVPDPQILTKTGGVCAFRVSPAARCGF
jgi:hypothetical protein